MNQELKRKLTLTQALLKAKIELKNSFRIDELHLIAGVDIAYWSDQGEDYGVCCIVILNFSTKEIVEQVECTGKITFPYLPGYLAFRELPLILQTIEKLESNPDLYMFDGNGYLHNQHMGIATHASFYLRKPTIGVAKTYFKIGNVDFTMPENQAGSFTGIMVDGEVYGRALRTRKDVKPIFVSCGNWIELDMATEITMYFIEEDSRLPTPLRYADIATRNARRRFRKDI